MNYIALCLLMVLAFCVQNKTNGQPFTKKYILSFHHCAIPACGGPQNHTIMLAESNDGENWSLLPNFPAYQGSVPDVGIRGDKLYIYTPGQVRRYNHAANQWDAAAIGVTIADSIGNPVQFADPSVFVDDNGKLCLFFLNTTGIAGDPANCAAPPCTAYFDSAIEVAGSDGSQFVKQNGHRLTYTTNSNFKPTDPDIFRAGNTFYLYISYGTGTMVYSSQTLHATYTLMPGLPNGYLTNSEGGIPSGLFHTADQLFYSYGHRNTANGTEISMAKHADFLSQPMYSTAFTGSSIGLGAVQVASPGICENSFLLSAVPEIKVGSGLRIYPNPSKGEVALQCEKATARLVISDARGTVIRTYFNIEANQTLHIFGLHKGLYLVHRYGGPDPVSYSKLLIE
jgi:hypothetical protein